MKAVENIIYSSCGIYIILKTSEDYKDEFKEDSLPLYFLYFWFIITPFLFALLDGGFTDKSKNHRKRLMGMSENSKVIEKA